MNPTVDRLRSTGREIRHGLRRRIRADRHEITGIPAAVSFTFDDVPRTAVTNGLRALESCAPTTTFYVATSLCGQDSDDYGPLLDHDELRALANQGHHIAAHSHSHRHLERGGESTLRDDCLENKRIIEDLVDGPCEDFAYPYGEWTYASKSELGPVFRSHRSIEPGVNQGSVDLRLLKSESLEMKHFSLERVEQVVEKCATEGGWLIFFSHDVSDTPTEYGITTRALTDVARVVGSSGVPVADVATARRLLFG